MKAEVVGKRKREIGLVVPAKYTAITNDIKFAQVLMEKLEEKQKIIDITIHEAISKNFPYYIYDHDEKEKEIEIQEEIDNEEN